MRRPQVGAVLLAAGRSKRMGRGNKLLREIDGVPMICRAADAFLEARVAPVVVVTGHESDAVASALGDRSLCLVVNHAYREGLSSSLRVGVDALPEGTEGVVVGLGDMPWVRADHIDALLDAFDPRRSAGVCVPVFEGKRGNPVLWAARYFDELKILDGDVGARALLARHQSDVRTVVVGDPGVLHDVDTPDMLATRGG